MLAMIGYVLAAAGALAAAAFGLVILLGGSAQLGKEAAIAADKASTPPVQGRGNEVGSATKTTGTGTAAMSEAKPAQPSAGPKPKPAKAAAKRKKRNAAARSTRRN